MRPMKITARIFKLFTFVFLTLIYVSCQKEKTLTVCGVLPDAAGKMVYVDSITSSVPICLDSAVVANDGSFNISLKPVKRMAFFQVRVDSMYGAFCADSTENIDFREGTHGELTLTGDDYAIEVCKLSQQLRATNDYINTLMLAFDRSPEKKELIKNLIYNRVMRYRKIADSIVKENPVSPAAYYAITSKLIYGIEPYDFKDEDDLLMLAVVANRWDIVRHGNVYSNSLLEKLAREEVNKINKKVGDDMLFSEKATFVDLNLPNAKHNRISLNSIKNKNVILLFWNLRKMDHEVLERIKSYYISNPDIEIYHVSFDQDVKEFDKMAAHYPWICVNDKEGKSALTYDLEVTPSVFLFNKRGNIVGKNVPFIGYKF